MKKHTGLSEPHMSAWHKSKSCDGSTMDIELPLDFKEFLKLLNEKAIIWMGTPPMRLEITTGISGVEFDECYKSRVIDLLDGIQVNIIGLEHLKINKKASGRLKDLADLENLS